MQEDKAIHVAPRIYLVGGAVRDQLLGRKDIPERDWVVVGATPAWMEAQGFTAVGKGFPVFLHPQTGEEYALARTERKSGQGYHGFVFHASPDVSLEDDLRRRDLTINAMAQDPDTGEIIDPWGGRQDLENRVLRHVSEAFEEDPLRVLRVARFVAQLSPWHFTLAPETRALMQRMSASDELKALTPERVWKEFDKALATPAPVRFFQTLHEVRALQVLLPEVAALDGIPQSPKWHPEGDVLTHTWMVVEAATRLSNDRAVRFAALMHDVGKGRTPKAQWPHHPGHEARGVPLTQAVCERYRLPREVAEVAILATRWHGEFYRGPEGKSPPETILEMMKAIDLFRKPVRFEQLLTVSEADYQGRLGFEEQPFFWRAWWISLAQSLRQLSPRPFVERGLQGADIGRALDEARLALIVEAQNEAKHLLKKKVPPPYKA